MTNRFAARVCAAPMAAVMTLGLALQPASAQDRDGRIPADTVIRVELERDLDGVRAREGDKFTAILSQRDRSGFPLDTRFEGVVTESQRATKDRPGVLDAEFRTAILPDGERVKMSGHLASLARKDNRRDANGRMSSKRKKSSGSGKLDPKWVGIGAGAGAVLATIMGESFFRGVLLGGLGGAVYGYLNRDKGDSKSSKNREDYRDVMLTRGTPFGIRLDDAVDFAGRGEYRYNRQAVDDDEGLRGGGRARRDVRYDQVDVRLDGTVVQFEEARPVNYNGELYVPLRPIAKAARMDFEHRAGDDTFTLRSGGETVRGTVGESMQEAADRDNPLNAPISLNGEIYVSTDYLSRAAGLRVDWQERENRLALHSYK